MPNLLFQAALLQRGLRAMDAMLSQTYQVNQHICLPQGGVYPKEFPAEGIDFRPLGGGVEGLKGIWRGWIYEDGGAGALKENVHSMVNDTVVDAFKVIDRCDKDKNSLVTKDEWDACQRGHTAEDSYYDFEYAFALYRVSGLMLKLEKEGTLNPTDPNTYPELITARADAKKKIAEKDHQISKLESKLSLAEAESALYQKISIGTSGLLGAVALILGVRAVLRGRKKKDKDRTPPPAPKPETPPAEKKTAPKEEKPAVIDDTSVPPPAPSDDIASELAKIAGDQSPRSEAVRPSGDFVTSENVIMPHDSTPEKRLDRSVVKAQVALAYSKFFMSQAAREALLEGKSLPTGESLISGTYAHYVDVLTDKIIADFNAKAANQDSTELKDMWDAQRDRDFLPRRGVPDLLLVSVANRQISEWTDASTPGFSSDAPRNFSHEAERRLSNTDSFQRGLVELLRDPTRLGR